MTRLTKSMEGQWREVGYLHLRNGILQDEVEAYLTAADELMVRHEKDYPQDRKKGNYVITATLFQTAELDPLVGLILNLMDPYFQVTGSEVYVRYPSDEQHRWHIDARRSLGQIRVTPESLPLNFKIRVFLTDIPKEDHPNFCFVPVSHRHQNARKGRKAARKQLRHRNRTSSGSRTDDHQYRILCQVPQHALAHHGSKELGQRAL